jgi:hypothetical protein
MRDELKSAGRLEIELLGLSWMFESLESEQELLDSSFAA